MKRILVLDDDQTRHDSFRALLLGCEVVHVKLFSEFTKALEGPRFDVAYLDHDLDICINQERRPAMYGSSVAYDGQDAAEHIAQLPIDQRPRRVVVHSWNEQGAARMVAALQFVGIDAKAVEYSSTGRHL